MSRGGPDRPALFFQQQVLSLWTDLFGGRLTVTTDPVTNESKGPLVRYFFAVARPVMGKLTPSIQSFRDIVERQKEFQAAEVLLV
jgi:hypothetical protein